MQPLLRAPIDHQVLPRHRHPWPIDAPLPLPPPPPGPLGLGHGAPEAARRAAVARRLRYRQQPLGRDPPVGGLHPLRDHCPYPFCVPWPRQTPLALRVRGRPPPLHHSFDRLVRRAAERGRGPIAAQFRVGIDTIHLVPRRLHEASPPCWRGSGWHLHHRQSEGRRQVYSHKGWGLFLATTGDFITATDSRRMDRNRDGAHVLAYGGRASRVCASEDVTL